MLRAGKLSHVVNVMRPTEATGDGGQLRGQDACVMKNWPCSIETLNGRESELAHTVFASATHKVEGYGDPRKPLCERDYLLLASIGADGKPAQRRLNIGFINDKHQNGMVLSLLCEELKHG